MSLCSFVSSTLRHPAMTRFSCQHVHCKHICTQSEAGPRHQHCQSVSADLSLHLSDKAELQVTIKALLSMPQGDGSVHLIRANPSLTKRKAGRLVDICYKSESEAGRWAYGQV